MISNFGNASNGAAPSSCVTVDRIVSPAVTEKFTCTKNLVYTEVNCTQDLNPSCSFAGSAITSMTTSGPTSVSEVSTGLYNYTIAVPFQCASTSYGSVTFNLDAPSQGAYMTANSNSLDDTAVVALNGIVIYFGHPNSGGSWNYPTFGTTAGFELGYQDTLYQQQCVLYDSEYGVCNAYDNIAVATSQFKLSDTCDIPSGSDSATWCTADGKLVGITVEGNDARSLNVTGRLPLKAGTNTIELFWGTQIGNGGACGAMTLTGQIYNVAPVCTTPWIDNCAPYEQSSGVQLGNPE
jgi:hypothetical protein